MKKINSKKILICLLSICMLFALYACGAANELSSADNYGDYDSNRDYSYKSESMDSSVSMAPGAIAPGAIAPSVKEDVYYEPVKDSATGTATPSIANINAEKIIYSANLRIESTEFDASVAAIDALVNKYGGFYESSNVNGSTRYRDDGTSYIVDRNGYFNIRIPSASYKSFLHESGTLGNTTSKSENAQNITAKFTDREARKLSLETQETRLLELLAEAKNIDAVIQLESRLSEVRYEIENIESTLRNWQNQVDYSLVSINLSEVAKYTPTVPVQRSFGERIVAAISGSFENFIEDGQDFLIDLIYSLPALIIWIAIIVVAVIVIRKLIRRSRANRKEKKPVKAEPIIEHKEENTDNIQ